MLIFLRHGCADDDADTRAAMSPTSVDTITLLRYAPMLRERQFAMPLLRCCRDDYAISRHAFAIAMMLLIFYC